MTSTATARPAGKAQGPLPPLLLVLTVVTGVVDAVSILRLGRVFVANMTGNVVFTGFALVGAPGFSLSASLAALAGFLVGALLGGSLTSRLGHDRGLLLRAGAAAELVLVAGALALMAALATPTGLATAAAQDGDAALLALAMGIQNAVARCPCRRCSRETCPCIPGGRRCRAAPQDHLAEAPPDSLWKSRAVPASSHRHLEIETGHVHEHQIARAEQIAPPREQLLHDVLSATRRKAWPLLLVYGQFLAEPGHRPVEVVQRSEKSSLQLSAARSEPPAYRRTPRAPAPGSCLPAPARFSTTPGSRCPSASVQRRAPAPNNIAPPARTTALASYSISLFRFVRTGGMKGARWKKHRRPAEILAALARQLKKGDKSLVGDNKGYRFPGDARDRAKAEGTPS